MNQGEPSASRVPLPTTALGSGIMPDLTSQLSSLAGRLLGNSGRLHFSISSEVDSLDAANSAVPIITEARPITPQLQHQQSSTASNGNFNPTTAAIPPAMPNSPTTAAAGIGTYGGLADAEAGVSRRYTHQDEVDHASDLAADAERLRITSTPISSLDIRSVTRALQGALPFMLLALSVFFYHHYREIIMLSFGTTMLHRCNTAIQQQVAKRADVQRRVMFFTACAAVIYAVITDVVGLRGTFLKVITLRFTPAAAADEKGMAFWSTLFTISLADLCVRLCLSCAKAVIVATAGAYSQSCLRRRLAFISSVDYVVGVERSILPAPLWIKYFQNSGMPWSAAMLLSGLYIIAKGFDVIDKASLAALAVIHQMQNSSYGTAVTPEEAAAAPSRECAICQEDARHPLRLSCGHSCFCAECIEEWLARESTCPICRQEVRRATLKQRGDGATSLFPVLC